jgi:hypothetical protein
VLDKFPLLFGHLLYQSQRWALSNLNAGTFPQHRDPRLGPLHRAIPEQGSGDHQQPLAIGPGPQWGVSWGLGTATQGESEQATWPCQGTASPSHHVKCCTRTQKCRELCGASVHAPHSFWIPDAHPLYLASTGNETDFPNAMSRLKQGFLCPILPTMYKGPH